METPGEELDRVRQGADEPAADEADKRTRRRLLLAAEIGLVLAIAGLLLLIWLPALIGAHPGSAGQR